MKITDVINAFNPQYVNNNKPEKRTREKESEQKSDKIEISAEAKKLKLGQDFVSVAKTALKDVPDIREEKINQVKGRINEGFYSLDSVKKSIGEIVLNNIRP